MSRNARRREPNHPKVERIELNEKNVPLRIVLMIAALALAVVSFGSFISDLLDVEAGWSTVEPTDPKTLAYQDFVLSYDLGAGELSAKNEQKAVSALFTETLDESYYALSRYQQEGVNNLYTLNAQPNTDIVVSPVLYRAFELLADCRYVYYAPLMDRYNSVFTSTYDEEAELYDPAKDEPTAVFAREVAAFAVDPDFIQVKLLGDNTLRLEVSQEYLDYAQEYEIGCFVDLGLLRNAFLCDEVADALTEAGYCNGVVSTLDGYTRNLYQDEFALNLFDYVDGTAKNLGAVAYQSPASLVSFRAFPVVEDYDDTRFYLYADGTVVNPFLGETGLPSPVCASLTTLGSDDAVAPLAIRTLEAFCADGDEEAAFESLNDLSWASTGSGEIKLHGDAFRLIEME